MLTIFDGRLVDDRDIVEAGLRRPREDDVREVRRVGVSQVGSLRCTKDRADCFSQSTGFGAEGCCVGGGMSVHHFLPDNRSVSLRAVLTGLKKHSFKAMD